MKIMRETVLKFIKQFQNKGTIETFTEGCCYWFAAILKRRFAGKATIMYNPIDNHFATKIGYVLYDITGMIPSSGFEPWDEFAQEDYLLTQRIIKDCILKV